MQKLLDDLQAAADTLPVDLEVQDDPLDEDDAPCVIVERQRLGVDVDTPIQLGGTADADVYLAFPHDTRWDDIELVTGAFVKAYKEQAPATDITTIEMGRGASSIRLVKLEIDTGAALELEALPSDFRYRYL